MLICLLHLLIGEVQVKPSEKKQILIAGATGLIGKELTRTLVNVGYRVMILTRSPNQVHEEFPDMVGYIEWGGIFTTWLVREVENSAAVINLAGEGIASKRWTRRRRMQLIRSRLGTTRALAKACHYSKKKPKVFLQASATGYYPLSLEGVYDETSAPGKSFLSRLTVDWEAVALHEVPEDIRLVLLRTGVVLSTKGGMLQQLIMPIKLFAGGWFGTGNQFVSWIHLEDEVRAIIHLMESKNAKGPFNLTSPSSLPQKELVKMVAQKLSRPAWLPIPSITVKLLFGQMGKELLLSGNNVIPYKLNSVGFEFKYPTLDEALSELLK